MSTITTATPAARRVARTPVWLVGIAAIVLGSVVTEIYGVVVEAAGVPMVAGSPGATPSTIDPGDYSGGVVFFGAIGVVIAVALARWARAPRRTWTVAAWILAVLSLVGPVLADGASTATHLALIGSHLVAAAVVVPVIGRRLPETNRRRG